jgi:hypothetical protein
MDYNFTITCAQCFPRVPLEVYLNNPAVVVPCVSIQLYGFFRRVDDK